MNFLKCSAIVAFFIELLLLIVFAPTCKASQMNGDARIIVRKVAQNEMGISICEDATEQPWAVRYQSTPLAPVFRRGG